MKIIKLHTDYQKIIKKAIRQDNLSQKKIYEDFSPKMLGVCRQYITDRHYAEDLMIESFVKVFSSLYKFKFEGSFEGWIRRIMVNQCISFLRKKNLLSFTDNEKVLEKQQDFSFNVENTFVEDLYKLIDTLPCGYKIVFNLYVIEGYKHYEIAEKLEISENTSKSQLYKARKLLQKKYLQFNSINYEN